MKRSDLQNQYLAKQIKAKLGLAIYTACAGTGIPVDLVAGLVSVENGGVDPKATRFEPHVYEKLKQVANGSLHDYNRITKAKLGNPSDYALRALATSYGYTQIMGYWVLHLGGTVDDLRNPIKHLNYTVALLHQSMKWITSGNYGAIFRIWNTGSPTGQTKDPSYAANAMKVAMYYRDLSKPLAKELPQQGSVREAGSVAESQSHGEPVEIREGSSPVTTTDVNAKAFLPTIEENVEAAQTAVFDAARRENFMSDSQNPTTNQPMVPPGGITNAPYGGTADPLKKGWRTSEGQITAFVTGITTLLMLAANLHMISLTPDQLNQINNLARKVLVWVPTVYAGFRLTLKIAALISHSHSIREALTNFMNEYKAGELLDGETSEEAVTTTAVSRG